MTSASANPYLRTKVLTASPAELRLMLFDGALRFLGQARAGLEAKDHEQAFNGLTRAQQIIMELLSGLRPEHDPDLCRQLSALYTFMYTRLVTASLEKDVAIIDEVLGLLRYERETWVMLMEQLAREKAAANMPTDGGLSLRG